MVAMIALSFISLKLLELKIHVANDKKEVEIFLWMTAQVVIVVAMITSFIISKSLEPSMLRKKETELNLNT